MKRLRIKEPNLDVKLGAVWPDTIFLGQGSQTMEKAREYLKKGEAVLLLPRDYRGKAETKQA